MYDPFRNYDTWKTQAPEDVYGRGDPLEDGYCRVHGLEMEEWHELDECGDVPYFTCSEGCHFPARFNQAIGFFYPFAEVDYFQDYEEPPERPMDYDTIEEMKMDKGDTHLPY